MLVCKDSSTFHLDICTLVVGVEGTTTIIELLI